MTVLFVGSLVSYLTGPRDLNEIDPELISPVIHRFLPQSSFNNFGQSKAFYHRAQNMPMVNEVQPMRYEYDRDLEKPKFTNVLS